MINNFKTGEIRGFWRFGTWLHFLIFENIIYIFLRVSLLNVFVYFISFKKILLCGVLHRDKQMKDILREAVVEKSRSCSFLLSLLKVHVIASVCVCVRACEWVFVRIHQGVIWNYFRQRRSVLIAFFSFGTEKKNRTFALLHLGSSALLPPDSLPFHTSF